MTLSLSGFSQPRSGATHACCRSHPRYSHLPPRALHLHSRRCLLPLHRSAPQPLPPSFSPQLPGLLRPTSLSTNCRSLCSSGSFPWAYILVVPVSTRPRTSSAGQQHPQQPCCFSHDHLRDRVNMAVLVCSEWYVYPPHSTTSGDRELRPPNIYTHTEIGCEIPSYPPHRAAGNRVLDLLLSSSVEPSFNTRACMHLAIF